MITLHAARNAIGDVNCLNCGRALAQVVRDPEGTGLNLLPAVNQSTVQVIVAGRRLLRCRRCGGRGFVELREETPIEELQPTMGPPVRDEPELVAMRPGQRVAQSRDWRVASREHAHAHRQVRASR